MATSIEITFPSSVSCVQINIASSTTGSRMSLNASSADEKNDDDFGDAISLVHGMIPGGATKRKHHQSGK